MINKAKFMRNGVTQTITDLLRQANYELRQNGVTVEAVADECGVSPEAVYGYQGTNESTFLRVTRLVTVQAQLGSALVLDRMAVNAGYLLVKMPDIPESGDQSAMQACAEVVSEASAAVGKFVETISDRVYTREEREELRTLIRKLQAGAESLDVIAGEYCEASGQDHRERSASRH